MKINGLVLGLLCCTLSLNAQEIINLNGTNLQSTEKEVPAPGESKDRILYNINQSSMTAYLPEKNIATGTAMVIAPGGAFHILSWDNEGTKVAEYLNSKGVAAFVLKYRTGTLKTDNSFSELMGMMGDFKKLDSINAPVIKIAIEDAQMAIKHIRNNAEKYDIDPEKVGMMGFSAGGTLTLGTLYSSDKAARANFIAPIYPYVNAVIDIEKIPAEKTPIFIALASDDQLGFAPQDAQLYLDWLAAKQPAELHIYERGGHGFGMNNSKISTDTWEERLTDWMKMQGYLKKRYPSDWEKKYTEEEIAAMRKAGEERVRKDWAYLSKYSAENTIVKAKGKKPKAVLLGDSITEGWVNTDKAFFEENNLIGRGISGQTSPQTLLRFQPDVVELQPDVVVINIGTNDVAENTGDYDPNFTLGNYKSMIAAGKAAGIKIILASVLPASSFPWRKEINNVPEKIIALNAAIKKLANDNGLYYLDYFNRLKNAENGLSPDMAKDGVHPTPAGYKIMEAMVLDAINKVSK